MDIWTRPRLDEVDRRLLAEPVRLARAGTHAERLPPLRRGHWWTARSLPPFPQQAPQCRAAGHHAWLAGILPRVAESRADARRQRVGSVSRRRAVAARVRVLGA